VNIEKKTLKQYPETNLVNVTITRGLHFRSMFFFNCKPKNRF